MVYGYAIFFLLHRIRRTRYWSIASSLMVDGEIDGGWRDGGWWMGTSREVPRYLEWMES